MTAPTGSGGVLAVLDRARDVLAEIYAKHQRAIGPFASQAQKSNGSLREARATVEAMAEALVQARALFQRINRDEDGDEHLNVSCDGMDLLDPVIARFHGTTPPATDAVKDGSATSLSWRIIEANRLIELDPSYLHKYGAGWIKQWAEDCSAAATPPAGGNDASAREMIRWLNGDVLQVLLDVSNCIDSPGSQDMARNGIRRVEAIVARLASRGGA